MAVLQMQKISVCALKRYRRKILERIQTLGIIELREYQDSEATEGFGLEDTADMSLILNKKLLILEQSLEVLAHFSPESKTLFSSFVGKPEISKDKLVREMRHAEDIVEKSEHINACYKEYNDNLAVIAKLNENIEALKPWQKLDIPLNFSHTKTSRILLGTMPAEADEDSMLQLIALKAGEDVNVDLQIISKDAHAVYVAAVSRREDANMVEDALRSGGFARLSLDFDRTPSEAMASCKRRIARRSRSNDRLEASIKEHVAQRQEIKKACDYFRMEIKGSEVTGKIQQSKRTFMFTGYVPLRDGERVKRLLEEQFDCLVELVDVTEDEEAPTLLANDYIGESGEEVLSSYGLPKHGSVDPTKIMSWFYIFFFGMMLSDAAYGLIMAIGCFAMLKKFPKMKSNTCKMLRLFGLCGLSTLFWGIMFGGYFGDAPTVIAKHFFGTDFVIRPLWFAPLDNPMQLLIWCMLFGVIHLFTGLAIKGYQELKNGQILDFFCDVIFWYMLLTGLILMLLPSTIFASISQMQIHFSPQVSTIAKVLALAGMLGILLMSGRGHKNPAIRIALGAYDLYGVTGWLSDVLSYSRLLALGLATGVIASVINMMASMLSTGVIGTILFIVLFVLGHTLNMAINVLGAYVHTNRLQFVEFFSKFFEAGGKPFEPLTNDSRYIEIK